MTSAVPNGFHFVANVADFDVSNARVVRIPAGLLRKRDLLTVLVRGLDFPGYFGWNWDALEESLCSLGWLIDSRRVVVIHEGLPFQPDWENRETYLSILRHAVSFWSQSDECESLQPNEEHELIAVFPEHCRDDVLNAI